MFMFEATAKVLRKHPEALLDNTLSLKKASLPYQVSVGVVQIWLKVSLQHQQTTHQWVYSILM